MDNNPFSNTRFKKRSFLLPIAVIILLVLLGSLVGMRKFFGAQNGLQAVTLKEGDYLIYVLSNRPEKSQMIFYDLANGTHVPILSDWGIDGISVSARDQLAFSTSYEDSGAVYVLDYPFTNSVPENIASDTSTWGHELAWSPDGRYLAYVSERDDGATLSIWNGQSSSLIAQSPAGISEITWSTDGRLAFTIFYSYSSPHDGDDSEVFIWDGNTTVSLSQNPTGGDRLPAWNENGQIAFLSEQKEAHDIYIWDGVSINNGLPDANTFSSIAPYWIGYISHPVWTNSGSLTFEASGEAPGLGVQIYEWDGKSAVNISQNSDFHNGGQRWRSDGYWAFITYFSSEQLIYIRDKENQTVLTTEGQYVPAWSTSGYLMFCVKAPSGWTLSMWEGRGVINIAQGNTIEASWSNGERVFCSS